MRISVSLSMGQTRRRPGRVCDPFKLPDSDHNDPLAAFKFAAGESRRRRRRTRHVAVRVGEPDGHGHSGCHAVIVRVPRRPAAARAAPARTTKKLEGPPLTVPLGLGQARTGPA
jgi:hypothetical protein